ncbi:MAG: FkbM family methyltransferase [Marinicaulis sp.]|nr:FkbM family methyltransferase [Marinicaulis sp.]
MFDIGANVGQMSSLLLKLGARVVSLEPNKLCHPALQYQCGKNPDFSLVEKAVSNEPGMATLHFEGTASTASLRSDWEWLKPRKNRTVQTCDVPVTTIDALIAEYGLPDYCKIDVEGFELECIQGMSQPVPLLSFEYHRAELRNARACLEALSKLSPIATNITTLDHAEFAFADWRSSDETISYIFDNPAIHAGDIFVRSAISNQTSDAAEMAGIQSTGVKMTSSSSLS